MGAIRNLVDALRREGLTVHEWAGWDGRGNEGIGQIEPHGAVIHHTATPYGGAFNGLVSSTRPGMLGAVLCNFSGNSDGSLTVIASGLAWHAGQGAGPSLGALAPWRSWLNRYSVGLEIVYPGDRPMTDAQYRTAVRFSRVVADMFGGGNVECIRAHAETNGAPGDGKWDPGYAPGKTIDMTKFRRDVLGASGGAFQEDDVAFDANSGNVVFKFKNDYGQVEAGVFAELVGRSAQRAWEIRREQGVQSAVLAQILAAVKDDLDADAVLARVDAAVRSATEQAINSVVLPALRGVLADSLDDDNSALADEILTKMGRQLAASTKQEQA